jgi:hypothetical protein
MKKIIIIFTSLFLFNSTSHASENQNPEWFIMGSLGGFAFAGLEVGALSMHVGRNFNLLGKDDIKLNFLPAAGISFMSGRLNFGSYDGIKLVSDSKTAIAPFIETYLSLKLYYVYIEEGVILALGGGKAHIGWGSRLLFGSETFQAGFVVSTVDLIGITARYYF